MAKMKEHELTSYEFADEPEALQAAILTDGNLMMLRNELCTIAAERAKLAYDPESQNAQQKFLLESEYLRGKYEQTLFILSLHINAKDRMAALVREMIEQNEADASQVGKGE